MELKAETLSSILQLLPDVDISATQSSPSPISEALGSGSVMLYSPEDALSDMLVELSLDERLEVAALMWLGRGDFPDFETALSHAQAVFTGDPMVDASYITDKGPVLKKYLQVGASKAGFSYE